MSFIYTENVASWGFEIAIEKKMRVGEECIFARFVVSTSMTLEHELLA